MIKKEKINYKIIKKMIKKEKIKFQTKSCLEL